VVSVALLVATVLVITLRPEPRGRTATPAPPALTSENLNTGPPGAPAGPVDSGVEPSTTPSASAPGTPAEPRPPANPPPAGDGPPPPPAARYAALSGESCPQRSTAGYYRKGWHTDWYTRSSGGWTGDGCGGQVVAVPMSGDPNKDDGDNVIVWWFSVGAKASCAISVYVPGTGYALDAAGAPATYFVYGTTNASGTAIAKFTVDQVHNQGRWVDTGSYAQTTGQLSVRMVTRGIDWGPGRQGAHLGVSALRVSC